MAGRCCFQGWCNSNIRGAEFCLVILKFPEWLSNSCLVHYKSCWTKSIWFRALQLGPNLCQTHAHTQKNLQGAVPFRDVAISIFRELIFYDIYYRKCCFVLFKRKLASQKVFALGAQNFVRFSTRKALTHRKNCRSLGLLGMMLFQYLEGSISMTHTVVQYSFTPLLAMPVEALTLFSFLPPSNHVRLLPPLLETRICIVFSFLCVNKHYF